MSIEIWWLSSDEQQAIVVNGWEDKSEWDVTKGWARYNAKISRNEEGKLVLSFASSRGKFEIRVEKDRLEGVYRGHFLNYITMKRIRGRP